MHAAQLLAESAEHAQGGIAPVGIGLVTFGVLVLLLAVTWSFRNVSNRH